MALGRCPGTVLATKNHDGTDTELGKEAVMNPRKTTPKTCMICSGETRDAVAEFCASCDRRMEIAFHQLGTDGSAVMVPDRVN